MKPRSLALVATGLLAACSLSSCTSVQADAARVNGTRIKMSDMEELAVTYKASQAADSGTPSADREGTIDLTTVRKLTSAEISIQLVEDRLTRRGKPITDVVRNNQRDQYATDTATAAQWKALPPLLQKFYVESKVASDAIGADQTLLQTDPSEKLWINPALGQFDPTQGIVALGTPPETTSPAVPGSDATASDSTSSADTIPADTSADTTPGTPADASATAAPATSQP